MKLIDRTKIYGKAAVKAVKENLPKRPPKKKKTLPEIIDPAKRWVLAKGGGIAAKAVKNQVKMQRNNLLGISREGGQAVDDLIDLAKTGENMMNRRQFIGKMIATAKEHNPPKIVDQAKARLPESVKTKIPKFSAYTRKKGLLKR